MLGDSEAHHHDALGDYGHLRKHRAQKFQRVMYDSQKYVLRLSVRPSRHLKAGCSRQRASLT